MPGDRSRITLLAPARPRTVEPGPQAFVAFRTADPERRWLSTTLSEPPCAHLTGHDAEAATLLSGPPGGGRRGDPPGPLGSFWLGWLLSTGGDGRRGRLDGAGRAAARRDRARFRRARVPARAGGPGSTRCTATRSRRSRLERAAGSPNVFGETDLATMTPTLSRQGAVDRAEIARGVARSTRRWSR